MADTEKYIVHIERHSGDVTTFTQHTSNILAAIEASQKEHFAVWGYYGEPVFAQLQKD